MVALDILIFPPHEVSGDAVEHEADAPTQKWVPSHEEDEFQVGKADSKGRDPLEHVDVVANEEAGEGEDQGRQLDQVLKLPEVPPESESRELQL